MFFCLENKMSKQVIDMTKIAIQSKDGYMDKYITFGWMKKACISYIKKEDCVKWYEKKQGKNTKR